MGYCRNQHKVFASQEEKAVEGLVPYIVKEGNWSKMSILACGGEEHEGISLKKRV